MRILGIGTDIVECPRIGRMIEQHGDFFLRRVYTDREIRYCQARRRSLEHFAGRWAAKEAILKALGTGWAKGICWTDLEVRNANSGAPRVHVRGIVRDLAIQRGIADIMISISHCRTYATAYALAIGAADNTAHAPGPLLDADQTSEHDPSEPPSDQDGPDPDSDSDHGSGPEA